MKAVIPPIVRLPDNATAEEHRQQYIKSLEQLATMNPRFFLPLGVKWRWWHFLKQEHPLTELLNDR